jgi:signal transduction histidine kinase
MEAMGQLTGGVAHDFNNLLSVASGSLEMLEPRISDSKSLHLLPSAKGALSRGAKLTQSLLAFARKQQLNPIPADLNSIIREFLINAQAAVAGPRDRPYLRWKLIGYPIKKVCNSSQRWVEHSAGII